MLCSCFISHIMESSTPLWTPSAKIEDLFPPVTLTSNSASAAPRQDGVLREGSASIQLYSLATPNGKKLGIMLEELEVDYDAHGGCFCFDVTIINMDRTRHCCRTVHPFLLCCKFLL